MKKPVLGPIPWDMVVFLTVTTIGFGFSMQRMMHSDTSAGSVHAEPTPFSVALDETAKTTATQTLDLGCIERRLSNGKLRETSQDGAIRIKGRFCHLGRRDMKGFDGMRVKNLTNGYEGTIFFHGFDSSFVTDYLVLQSGKNVVELEWRESQSADPQIFTAEIYEK